jgi:hypothetical protein
MAGNNHLIMQPRDREFLRELAILRVVDHEQARRVAGFGSTSRANKRLLKLVRAGLLRRFFLGSGGGRKALYSLSEKGAIAVDVPFRGLRRKQGAVVAMDFFVEHQLAVNGVLLAARFEKCPSPEVRFAHWLAFHAPFAPDLRLIPDGYVEFTTPAGAAALFFEVDLGTESQKVWQEKTRQYVMLAVSGAFRRSFGHERFRVLVVANSTRRLESIRKTVAGVTQKIFRFATLDDARTKFFAPVWMKPVGSEAETLFETIE